MSLPYMKTLLFALLATAAFGQARDEETPVW